MLAIARGLMMDPHLLMLDEPSMGLAPILVELIFDIIKDLNAKRGTTILLVEQNTKLIAQVAHRAYAMDKGRIVATLAQENLTDKNKLVQYVAL